MRQVVGEVHRETDGEELVAEDHERPPKPEPVLAGEPIGDR